MRISICLFFILAITYVEISEISGTPLRLEPLFFSPVDAHNLNRSGWDVLDETINRIPIDYRDTIRESDVFRYNLWDDVSVDYRF